MSLFSLHIEWPSYLRELNCAITYYRQYLCYKSQIKKKEKKKKKQNKKQSQDT